VGGGVLDESLGPEVRHGQTLGTLSLIVGESRRSYRRDDLALAEELGRRAGSAMVNARLYREAEQARTRAERLQAVTAALSEAVTPAQVARAIVEEGLSSLQVDAGAVYVLEDEGNAFVLLGYRGYAREAEGAHRRVPVERSGPLGDVLGSGDLVVVESADELVRRWPYLARQQAQSGDAATIAAPLRLDGRAQGVLYLAFRMPRRFSDADRAFVLTLAQQCAQALERARLYEAEKHARARAEAAQDQLAAIFDAMADGVLVFGPGGSVVRMNRAARDLLGMTAPSEAYAAPLAERGRRTIVRDAEAHPLAEQDWPLFRVFRGEELMGPGATDLMVRTSDGRDLELSVTGAPMHDRDGRVAGAVCVVRDVTERRRLERRTHDALSALLQMAETLVLRPENDADSGAVPDRAPRQAAEEGGAGSVAQHLVELTCSVLGCRRVAISAVDEATWTVEPVAVVGLTPEQERQWRRGDPYARLNQQLRGPAVRARLRAGEVLALDAAQPPLRGRPNPHNLRSFLLVPMHVGRQFVGVLFLDHGGAEHAYTAEEQALASAVAKLAALVIERERLLRERAEARAAEIALREANARMDAFLNIASHELKTPLTTLKGLVQLAQRRLQQATMEAASGAHSLPVILISAGELLARTDRQMTRMDALINDLLDISRIQAGQLALRLAHCDLAGVVSEAVEEQRAAWSQRIISLDLAVEGPLEVVADAGRLSQVVTNFLTKALKYSPASAGVTVAVRREAGKARVSVRDAGPGIPAADQERLWERFYRVPGVEPQSGSGLGLGLGLHISRTIVERHHGRVGVESVVGQGSTFYFVLPLAPPGMLSGQ
jgi:signal transduction histidine kinase